MDENHPANAAGVQQVRINLKLFLKDKKIKLKILYYAGIMISLKQKRPQHLDDLSREELITKCKNLLLLAKKAKASKDGNYNF